MLSQLTRYASELGVSIRKAELEVRLEYDQRGKIMVADVSPAAQSVFYRWDIESDSTPAEILQVLQYVERGCHTLNSLREPVQVQGAALIDGNEHSVS